MKLSQQIDNFKILFVGRGLLENEIKEYSQKKCVDKYIDFKGVRWDLDKLFPMCDIGISSSCQEGLPMAIAEEMLCGLPVVASQDRGHRDLVIDNKTGFLYSQGDTDTFVKYVVELYDNKKNRKKMGQGAKRYVQSFKLDESLKKMSYIYSEILGEKIVCK